MSETRVATERTTGTTACAKQETDSATATNMNKNLLFSRIGVPGSDVLHLQVLLLRIQIIVGSLHRKQQMTTE